MTDAELLERAADLAAPWRTFPNPRVGCVIVDSAGVIVGEGAHHEAGGPHAEIHALAQAGDRARGGTAYVTLEPCAHTGRTGPCTEALIAAGIARVVVAVPDPDPVAAGGSVVLRDHGVRVDVVPSEPAAAVNEHWLHAMRAHRPFVTLKLATSLDGRVAAAAGHETQISGTEAGRLVHALRARVDGILVGAGTAIVDDPALTARGVPVQRQPRRFIMGRRPLPTTLQMLTGPEPGLQLRTHDPEEALGILHGLEIRHLVIEGGPTIARAFVEAGLVDELLWITAPVVLGSGPLAMGDGLLDRVHRWERVETLDLDGDLWSRMRP